MQWTTKIILAGALLAASSTPLVAGAAVNFDVSIGLPGFTTVVPQPVYYYSPPVYYMPAYTYAPRPLVRHRDWDPRWDRHHHGHRDRYHRHDHHRHDHRRHW